MTFWHPGSNNLLNKEENNKGQVVQWWGLFTSLLSIKFLSFLVLFFTLFVSSTPLFFWFYILTGYVIIWWIIEQYAISIGYLLHHLFKNGLITIQIQENNRTELERLDKERRADFLNMLKGFVVNQVCLVFLVPAHIVWSQPATSCYY